jgi:hypothetical protein
MRPELLGRQHPLFDEKLGKHRGKPAIRTRVLLVRLRRVARAARLTIDGPVVSVPSPASLGLAVAVRLRVIVGAHRRSSLTGPAGSSQCS